MEQTRSVYATFDNFNHDADMLYLTCHECQKAHNRSRCAWALQKVHWGRPCVSCQQLPQLCESDIERNTHLTDVEGWYREKQWDNARRA